MMCRSQPCKKPHPPPAILPVQRQECRVLVPVAWLIYSRLFIYEDMRYFMNDYVIFNSLQFSFTYFSCLYLCRLFLLVFLVFFKIVYIASYIAIISILYTKYKFIICIVYWPYTFSFMNLHSLCYSQLSKYLKFSIAVISSWLPEECGNLNKLASVVTSEN